MSGRVQCRTKLHISSVGCNFVDASGCNERALQSLTNARRCDGAAPCYSILITTLPRARRLATRIAQAALVHLRLRRHVRTRLAGCDAVVLGGGNLLTDADLNFPMKIAGALDQAARLRLPAAVYGVGANRQWSAAG